MFSTAKYKSHLSQILARVTSLQVNEAKEGIELYAGNINIASAKQEVSWLLINHC